MCKALPVLFVVLLSAGDHAVAAVRPSSARVTRAKGEARPGQRAVRRTNQRRVKAPATSRTLGRGRTARARWEETDLASATPSRPRFPSTFPPHLRSKVEHILDRRPVNHGFGLVMRLHPRTGERLWGVYERIYRDPSRPTLSPSTYRYYLVDAAGRVRQNDFD